MNGTLGRIAAVAAIAMLACSSEPKKDVAVPLDTTVLTSGPVDTSVLTVDGPGRVARTQPAAEGSGVLTDAEGAERAAPRAAPARDVRDSDRKDSDKDSDRKDTDRKKKKGKDRKSR